MLDSRMTFMLGIRSDFKSWVASASSSVVPTLVAGAPPFSTSTVALEEVPWELPSAPSAETSGVVLEKVCSVVDFGVGTSAPLP